MRNRDHEEIKNIKEIKELSIRNKKSWKKYQPLLLSFIWSQGLKLLQQAR